MDNAIGAYPVGATLTAAICLMHGVQVPGAFCPMCGIKLVRSLSCPGCGHERYLLSDQFCRYCGARWDA